MKAEKMIEALCYIGNTENVGSFSYSKYYTELNLFFGEGELTSGELMDEDTYLYAYGDTDDPDTLDRYARHDAEYKLEENDVIVYLYRLELVK